MAAEVTVTTFIFDTACGIAMIFCSCSLVVGKLYSANVSMFSIKYHAHRVFYFSLILHFLTGKMWILGVKVTAQSYRNSRKSNCFF